jgi:hypothetical protein
MTIEEAQEIVNKALTAADSEYARMANFSYSAGQVRDALKRRQEAFEQLQANQEQTQALQDQYTGWSRFFLVTSSQGHIHSSMHCSTCRPTTRYGWLPNHSGKIEAVVVNELGPALCSVCFPSAPIDWQGQKLSKRQAEDILAGKPVTAEPKKEYCPGSGQRMIEPSRTGYAAGNWGTCPHCHAHASLTTSYGPTIRKHPEKKA